jgi:hypothetical protein
LLGVAEIGVGMAGFAGVAAAILLGRSFQRDDQLRFLALFFSTISVVLLAFVPLLLVLGGVAPTALWRWSSAAFLLVAAGGFPLGVTIAREARTFDKVPPKWTVLPLWGLFVAAPMAQVANLIGAAGGPGPVLYLSGLLCWLGAGAILFVIIVLLRPRESE